MKFSVYLNRRVFVMLCYISSVFQIQDIANGASSDNEYVDWRRFLMALAQPIPTPTQTELLETLYNFNEMDQKNTGFVTKEQYDRVSG